ncbi:hypothetical protein C4566_03465 [Candidatus Parcubacteria bacterium]|nr:MAG: hypothetical protein C4566_03465 [Candidatus Parcubacteria bacterium]
MAQEGSQHTADQQDGGVRHVSSPPFEAREWHSLLSCLALLGELVAEQEVIGSVAAETTDHARSDRAAAGSQRTGTAIDDDRHSKAQHVAPALVLGDIGVLVDGLLVVAVATPEFGRRQADIQELSEGRVVVRSVVELTVPLVDLPGVLDLSFGGETVPPHLLFGSEQVGDQLDRVLLGHLATTFHFGQDILGRHALDAVAVADLVDRSDDDHVLVQPIEATLGRLGQGQIGVDLVEHLGVDPADRDLGVVVGVGDGDLVGLLAADEDQPQEESRQAQADESEALHFFLPPCGKL